MLLYVFDQTILILPHLEKIIVFAELLDRAFAFRAEAVLDVSFRPESLVKCAVPSSIVSLVNLLVIIEPLKI